MKKEKDLNYIVKVEKAIKEKYGEETIVNPKSKWDEEKESKYLECLREFYGKKKEKTMKTKVEDFYISEKLVLKDINKSCPTCKAYSFNLKDDLNYVFNHHAIGQIWIVSSIKTQTYI